jgi:hypothetical protein
MCRKTPTINKNNKNRNVIQSKTTIYTMCTDLLKRRRTSIKKHPNWKEMALVSQLASEVKSSLDYSVMGAISREKLQFTWHISLLNENI